MDKARYGIARDMQQLKEGASGSASELREFLKDMKGKDPHEVLGMIAQSSLIQATGVATIGTLILLVVGTVGPYYIWPASATAAPQAAGAGAGHSPTAAAPGANAAGSQPQANAGGGTPGAGALPGDPSKTGSDGTPGPKKTDDVLEKMGIADEKQADPNVNPLDKNDDILKGIE